MKYPKEYLDEIKTRLKVSSVVSKTVSLKKRGKEFLVGSLLPDVDSDISYDQRYKVIQYIERKHEGRTAKILTFNTFSSKLCIREATKYFDEAKEDEANQVSDMIPKLHGVVFPLKQAEQESDKFTKWVKNHSKTFKNALKVENLPKNTGVHPSGIAISHHNLSEICPTQKTADGNIVSGYDMHWVSELMVKFDILGLRTLSVIYDVCNSIGIDVYDIDINAQDLYQPLQELENPHGLFQIEADTNFKI